MNSQDIAHGSEKEKLEENDREYEKHNRRGTGKWRKMERNARPEDDDECDDDDDNDDDGDDDKEEK